MKNYLATAIVASLIGFGVSMSAYADDQPAPETDRSHMLTTPIIHGDVVYEQGSPEYTIAAIFDGMRNGDGAAMKKLVYYDEGTANRVAKDSSLRLGKYEAWITNIDKMKPGDAVEHLFDIRSDVYGNLASVWTPFMLYFKGDLVSCGVNHFTLVREEAKGQNWKILNTIDTHHKGDCKTFGPDFYPSDGSK